MVEHHPVEKHMVYGRPFEGTAFPAKLAEKACPVRSALKRPSIKNIFFKQVVFYYLMGTNYETIGDIMCFICMYETIFDWCAIIIPG